MGGMMQANERRAGIVLSYLWIGLNSVVGLLFTPFLLRSLGQAEFGLYQLISSFLGFLVILDFGIGATITRYVAKYREEHDKGGEENFLVMCLLIYSMIAATVLALGALAYIYLDQIFADSLTPSELSKAKTMFVILVFSVAATIFDKAIQGALSGCERFVFPRTISLTRICVKIPVLIVLLLSGLGAVAVVATEAAINVAVLVVNTVYAFEKVNLRVRLHHWDKVLFTETLAFSFFVFLGLFATLLWWRMPQFLLGVMTSTTIVAVFAVAMQLNALYQSLATVIAGVFLPKATQLVLRGASGEDLTSFMIAPSRYQLMLLGGLLSGFVLFGRQFVVLWAGPSYEGAYAIAVTVMVPITIPLTQTLGTCILQAKNRHAFRSVLYLIIAICSTILSIFLIKQYGAIGAAAGTAGAIIAGNIVIMNCYYHYKIGLNIPRFLRELCRGILPVILVASGLGYLFLFPLRGSWGTLATRCILFAAVYSLLLCLFGMNRSEKQFFLSCTVAGLRMVGLRVRT
ncbi:MAG: hypothetical protein CEE38_23220 [Planctomycetes bacterium B3_Pla]|nr:MAG: hypothetical protein CEE38_23220 [Planctomycetes bacterium B3_Pla]